MLHLNKGFEVNCTATARVKGALGLHKFLTGPTMGCRGGPCLWDPAWSAGRCQIQDGRLAKGKPGVPPRAQPSHSDGCGNARVSELPATHKYAYAGGACFTEPPSQSMRLYLSVLLASMLQLVNIRTNRDQQIPAVYVIQNLPALYIRVLPGSAPQASTQHTRLHPALSACRSLP